MSRTRVPELDLLRFTAAAAVVVFHFYVLLPGSTAFQQAIAGVSRFGFLGVPLFFMISGFVILWTAFNRGPGQFALARFCRLFPSYWVCVLITSAVLGAAGGAPSWRQILANLTMCQHLFGYDSVDEVYWTLFIELKFYALVFMLLLFGQLQQIERALMGEPDSRLIWRGIENPHPFHRRRPIEPPAAQRFVAGPQALKIAWHQAAPAPREHRQEMRGKAQLLQGRIHPSAPADRERVAAVTAPGDRDLCRMQRSRQIRSLRRRKGYDRRADRGKR